MNVRGELVQSNKQIHSKKIVVRNEVSVSQSDEDCSFMKTENRGQIRHENNKTQSHKKV